jgi:malonyl-CoA O-methyltransferase
MRLSFGFLRRTVGRVADRLCLRHVPELPPREAYRLWAPHYPPRAHTLLMQIEQEAVLHQLPPVHSRRVVDLACGTGRYAVALGAQGASVVGVDLSLEMLSRAPGGFSRAQGDLRALPLRACCADIVVCGLAVGHVEDLSATLAEMARVLVPGGCAVYSDLHPKGRALGWRRDFRATDGRRYAVAFTAHRVATHRNALARAGLALESLREVGVGEEAARRDPEAARFRRQWGDTPVLLVVRARKP